MSEERDHLAEAHADVLRRIHERRQQFEREMMPLRRRADELGALLAERESIKPSFPIRMRLTEEELAQLKETRTIGRMREVEIVRSYRDRKCFHCSGMTNLAWSGRLGWVCVDHVKCKTANNRDGNPKPFRSLPS